jgi:hypothetical protein
MIRQKEAGLRKEAFPSREVMSKMDKYKVQLWKN